MFINHGSGHQDVHIVNQGLRRSDCVNTSSHSYQCERSSYTMPNETENGSSNLLSLPK